MGRTYGSVRSACGSVGSACGSVREVVCFGGVPVGVDGVLGIDWARRGCNGGVSSFLSSSIQLMI